MNWQQRLLVVGIVALSVGLLGVLAPGVVAVGFGRPVASLVGIAALVQAGRVGRDRLLSDHSSATTANVEERIAVQAPGDDLSNTLEEIVVKRDGITTRMQAELNSTALDVLTWYGGYAKEDAKQQIKDGTWTDDEWAAAFLDDSNSLQSEGRLKSVLSSDTNYRKSVHRTIEEIARIASLSSGDTASRESAVTSVRNRLGKIRTVVRNRLTSSTDVVQGSRAPSELTRETDNWTGISVVALVGIGVGVLAEQSGLLLVGVVGICYAAYARTQAIDSVSLSVERDIEDVRPATGESVEVSVTVTNEGETTLPDLRLVDGVPAGLAVESGSPRNGTLLRPGQSTEFSYTVTARRGSFEFGPLQVIARNLPGTVEHERSIEAETPTTMTCIPPLAELPVSVPLPEGSTRYAGTEETNAGGEGMEFHSTREYRSSDPMSRIDWNTQAKTGELATLVFREERTATVVLVIDNDPSAYLAPQNNGSHALDRSVDAAGLVFKNLLDARNRVGIATLGDTDCWLPPQMGSAQEIRGQKLLATHESLSSVPEEPDLHEIQRKRTLYRRLPSDAHLMLFSPLCDDMVTKTARQFEAAGYPVTVISPDPTAAATPEQLLARIRRRLRISDLRHSGVPVVDWKWDEPLGAALSRFAQRGREIR